MSKVLLIGGNGYIGKITQVVLAAAKHEFAIYDKAINPMDDILDTKRLEAAMRGCDAVFHLVAIPHPFKANETEYKKINYELAIEVFQCAARAGVKKFIFPSSGCIYGFWGGACKAKELPITENCPLPSIEEGNSLYGYYKNAFEKYLAKNSKKAGIHSISLRLEGITGRRVNTAEIPYDDNGRISKPTYTYQHFFACCSPENFQQILDLVLTKKLKNHFEAFNTGNDLIEEYMDVQSVIKKYWPHLKNKVKGNGALYSVEKAKRLLGYKPLPPIYSSPPKFLTEAKPATEAVKA